MKIRNQRTHFSGFSNRQIGEKARPETVFERSIKKSQMSFYKSNQELSDREWDRVNPYLGHNNELETLRFDKANFKQYKEKQMPKPSSAKVHLYASHLNREVKDIIPQFAEKKINMHKLWQLKHTFVKNNKNRRNIKQYFEEYSKGKDEILLPQLIKIVHQYGYDINDEQGKLIFKLTNRKSSEKENNESLDMEGFMELMTKEDIHFKTLRVGNNVKSFTKPPKLFSDKVHQVLRNKFPKMKEAFEIYTKRKEKIGIQEFNKVMKKMDLNDLVLSEKERQNIFKSYSHEGNFNVEALLCAIVEDESNRVVKLDKNMDFLDEVQVNEEKEDKKQKKIRNFSLKNLSFLEYQKQLQKAQQIIEELRKISKNLKKDIVQEIVQEKNTSKKQIQEATENMMRKEGVNFTKEEYDAFLSYLDFDSCGYLSKKSFRKAIFEESEKEARERFQRRCRNEEPKTFNREIVICDQKSALETLSKVKHHKMNPESRQLFKYFDADHDGFVSTKELELQLSKLQILSQEQIKNLAAFLDSENNGSIKYSKFAERIKSKEELPFVQRKLSLQHSFRSEKKEFIQTFNNPNLTFRNTKYSAWPSEKRDCDFSLLQPSANCAMHVSEANRFGERREDYALKEKMKAQNVSEKNRDRRARWNCKIDESKEKKRVEEESRLAANNYLLRLTKQTYENRCSM